jgi:hypothetical protein
MKNYSYAVNTIRSIEGNKVTCNVLKYRTCNSFGRHPILTSLSKWSQETLTLNDAQMNRFNNYADEDTKRAYLTKLLSLS